MGLDGRVVGIVAGMVFSTAMHAALGVAIGALLRNQTAAVAAVLVWLLALEGILADVLRSAAVLDWLPGALAAALVGAGPDGVPAWAAGVGLSAYVAGFSALGARFVVGNDVT